MTLKHTIPQTSTYARCSFSAVMGHGVSEEADGWAIKEPCENLRLAGWRCTQTSQFLHTGGWWRVKGSTPRKHCAFISVSWAFLLTFYICLFIYCVWAHTFFCIMPWHVCRGQGITCRSWFFLQCGSQGSNPGRGHQASRKCLFRLSHLANPKFDSYFLLSLEKHA